MTLATEKMDGHGLRNKVFHDKRWLKKTKVTHRVISCKVVNPLNIISKIIALIIKVNVCTHSKIFERFLALVSH